MRASGERQGIGGKAYGERQDGLRVSWAWIEKSRAKHKHGPSYRQHHTLSPSSGCPTVSRGPLSSTHATETKGCRVNVPPYRAIGGGLRVRKDGGGWIRQAFQARHPAGGNRRLLSVAYATSDFCSKTNGLLKEAN